MQVFPIDQLAVAEHRRALEFQSLPYLAQVVCSDEGVNPKRAGERLRAAIDSLLGECFASSASATAPTNTAPILRPDSDNDTD